MSENITHTAVTDDCARLAIFSPEICEPFKLCFRKHLDIVRLGGVTRSGGNFMLPLLTRFRTVWADRQQSEQLEEKLAYVLGWHTHRAADLQMKPIFEAVDGDCPLSPTDCSVYHDVFLFREVYGSGNEEPYSTGTLEPKMKSLPGAKTLEVDTLEGLFRTVWQAGVLGLQSFMTSGEGGSPPVERMLSARQEAYVDLDRYSLAFSDPDPDKMKRFVEDINFYDPDDAIVRLARGLQHEDELHGLDLERAVNAAESESQYAQTLCKGYRYLVAASEYFKGRIDEEGYKDVLERGKQGIN